MNIEGIPVHVNGQRFSPGSPDAARCRHGPPPVDNRERRGGARRRDQRIAFHVHHLKPSRVIHFDKKNTVVDIDKPRMARQGFSGDFCPFLEQRLVRIALQPAPFTHVLAENVPDAPHGWKSPARH